MLHLPNASSRDTAYKLVEQLLAWASAFSFCMKYPPKFSVLSSGVRVGDEWRSFWGGYIK